MKVGMPILFEYNSLIENVEFAKLNGFDFIELNLNFGYCREELMNKEIIDYLKQSNLDFTIHFFDEFDAASYDEVVDAYINILEKYLKNANDLNIKLLNIHLNVGPLVTISGNKNYLYEKEYHTYIKRLEKNLNKIKFLLDRYNIDLVLENVEIPFFIEKTYLDLAKLGFVFNYDIGHDYTDNNKIKELLGNYKFVFKEFHFHDATFKKCHLSLGEGNMELDFYKSLITDQYVVLEVKNSSELVLSINKFLSI